MNETVNMTESGRLKDPVSRRGFFKYALLGFSGIAAAVGVAIPVVSYLLPPKQSAGAGGGRVAVASTADLPPGKGNVFSVANKPVLVIHTVEGDFVALDATCTHLGCVLFWNEERGVIACPCHEAYFNTNGDVISGPPPAPLAEYRVQVDGEQIYVEGGEG